MKILVTAKRVVDPYVRIRLKSDGSGVDTTGLKMTMNPFDEIALEEALRLKEQGHATEVVLVSIGSIAVQETLRHGLALGADRALHIDTTTKLEPLNVAKALKEIVDRENPQLVLMGKQAIDDDYNQTAQMLSALLNWPLSAFASRINYDNGRFTVVREIDGGLETQALSSPCLITADLRLNTPRLASLPNIMKARQKPLHVITDITIAPPHLKILSIKEPSQRKAGVRVDTVHDLLDHLRNSAQVIS